MIEEEHPRLDWHLENWARYILVGGTSKLGVATSRYWASGSSDFDSMCDVMDLDNAIKIDAFIWSTPEDFHQEIGISEEQLQSIKANLLTHLERAAVCKKHLDCAWMHSNRGISLDDCYDEARMKISRMLFRKHIE